eukprot:s693_g7.t1
MLGSCCHPTVSHVRAKGASRFCGGLAKHAFEPSSKRASSRSAAVAASGAFAAAVLLRKTRRQLVCRFAKDPKSLDRVSARQQSMLDRLNDHAAVLGGECLAIGYTNLKTKVPWQCQHGHTWDALPNNVLNQKKWCPECARNKRRIRLQRLQDHARARGGWCLSTSKYNRSRAKVPWQCKLGHTWEASVQSVLHNGSWCPKCCRKGRTCKKRSLKDLQAHAASLGGRCLSTAYEGMRAPAVWQCHEGHTWRAIPDAVLNKKKTWCPVCAGNAPLNIRLLQAHAARRGGKCLAKKYVNSRSKVTWKCEHGHSWRAKPKSVLNSGSWCPQCNKIGLPRLRAHAAALGGRCLAKSYKDAFQKLLWECRVGHHWEASASTVLHGKSWCPECATTWRTEAEIRSILETIFHPAGFPSCYPSFLKGLQLDGYCPNLFLAFEYQGEQHYDPENYFHFGDTASFHSQQRRDARKVELCRDAGVRLLIIPFFVNDKRTFVLTSLLQWFSWAQIAPLELPGSRMEIQLQLPAPWVGEVQMLRQRDEKIGLQLEKLLQKVGPKLKKEATAALVDDAGEQLPGDLPAWSAWPRARSLRLEAAAEKLEVPSYWDPPVVSKCRMTSDCPLEGVPLLAEADLSGCDASSCSWTWQRRAAEAPKQEQWCDVATGPRYRPSSADVGFLLRVQCEPPPPGKKAFSATSKQPVSAAPIDAFRWECLAEPCSKLGMRVLTYNILADSCATRKTAQQTTFSYCDPAILVAGPRRQRILRDLLLIDADLMGLQEVDIGQRAALEPPLKDAGWDATFAGRQGCACGLLWRRARFVPEEPAREWTLSGAVDKIPGLLEAEVAAIQGHAATSALLAQVQTAAQSVILKDVLTGRRLLVANTHLYWHANANHIRLIQLHALLRVLAKEAARVSNGVPVAVLLFGDLNARKGCFGPSDRGCCSQAAYRLIRDGEIRREDPDWRFSIWQPSAEGAEAEVTPTENGRCICCQDFGVFPGLGTCPLCDGEGFGSEPRLSLELQRPLDLEDANEHLQVTNFTRDFQECLDYILIDRECLRVARRFPAPSLEALQRHTALPSPEFPSDHIPVFTEIEFK